MSNIPVALQRYLQRHIEPALPSAGTCERWQNCVVIPAYRESAELLQSLQALPSGKGNTLVIVVLNRPASDTDTQANAALRLALQSLPDSERGDDLVQVKTLNKTSDLFLHDMEQINGPIATNKGVGLARKTGCDIALLWQTQGALNTQWIHCTDADARLPADYFTQTNELAGKAVAATYRFTHAASGNASCDIATGLYELRMHHYVYGLHYAGSAYAHHSLGSCIAVKPLCYAQVRGFPQRAGGEDFYLLSKLAKIGPIASLRGAAVTLQSRLSDRVPFGTGPATARIAASAAPFEQPLFYHPHSFDALRAILQVVPMLQDRPFNVTTFSALLEQNGLDINLAGTSSAALNNAGIAKALQHCQQQSSSTHAFKKHFDQWFDALRTLRFIHTLRDSGLADQPLAALPGISPQLFPVRNNQAFELNALRAACTAASVGDY